MGVDTKIHIPLIKHDLRKTIPAIRELIENKMPLFGDIEIEVNHESAKYDDTDAETREKSRINMYEIGRLNFALDYPCDSFESGKEQRSMHYYYDFHDSPSMLSLSIGAWGHNEDIARCLVDNFGGYADFSDCDSILIDYAMPQPKVKEPA